MARKTRGGLPPWRWVCIIFVLLAIILVAASAWATATPKLPSTTRKSC